MVEARSIREAIVETPIPTSSDGDTHALSEVYVPQAHIKALRLECNLVVGARGVGKSFWTGALGNPEVRGLLGKSVRELENASVRVGFAVAADHNAFPNEDIFGNLLGEFAPYDVWRAVIARWLATETGATIPTESWSNTAKWVKEHPEPFAKLVQAANHLYFEAQRHGLIVFDALDRTSQDWEKMDGIVRDLLRVVLSLKAYSNLHGKVFLREDQFARTVTDFPDASKLLSTKAELFWAPHDLHGLLWQVFCNAPNGHGEALRSVYGNVMGTSPVLQSNAWQIGEEAKREGPKQRELFEALAGKWMGRDPRRGKPYSWSIGHLADARARTSPRSFLAAMKAAAEDSKDRYPEHPLALHYESIKRGVQKASQIRVDEMAEDYPWVTTVMNPLKGITVPCEFTLVKSKWDEAFPDGPSSITSTRLPPQSAAHGWDGVRGDLSRLGIFENMKDDRVNLPDLYRVGFGLGRRGGVKPVR